MVVLRYSLGGLAAAGLLGFGLAGSSKIPGTDESLYKMSQTWLMMRHRPLAGAQLAVIFFVARPRIEAPSPPATPPRGAG